MLNATSNLSKYKFPHLLFIDALVVVRTVTPIKLTLSSPK